MAHLHLKFEEFLRRRKEKTLFTAASIFNLPLVLAVYWRYTGALRLGDGMDFQSFAAGIRKKSALPPVLIFAGPEALLRDRGLTLLREAHPDLAAGMLRIASS